MRHLALSSLLLASLASSGAAQGSSWTVGEPVPHVHLPDVRTGEAVDLADFRGKKILLAEFASW